MSDAPSLRDTIESAMSAQAEAPEPTPEVEAAPVEAAPEPVEAPQETAAEAAQRVRDEKGRFAKGEAAAEKPAAAPKGVEKADSGKAAAAVQGKGEGAATPPVAPTPDPVAAVKAPQSWTPAAREAFAKAPPEVQREVEKREKEIARALQDVAPVRQFASQVQESLRPYEGIARANGMDPMQWAGSALQMVASLYAGTPQQRAATIAKAIAMSGADVEAINAAMQGQPAQQAAPQMDIQAEIDRRFQSLQQQQEAQRTQEALQAFQATNPEFLNDVYTDMAEIIRLDRAKGGNLTLQQAYDRACKFNEGVQTVLSQRKATEAARAQAPMVQRAKVAASSIKAVPGATTTRAAGPRSLREDIEAAVAAQRT